MASKSGAEQRLPISYFEGVNSTVQHGIAKSSELFYIENGRSKVIGSIEKREGQQKFGTTAAGTPFYATGNFGLTKFINEGGNQGIFRLSTAGVQNAATLTLSVFDDVRVGEYFYMGDNNPALQVRAIEYITISEPDMLGFTDGTARILDGTSYRSSIYSLDNNNLWNVLADADGQNILGADADFAKVDDNLVMVNGRDYNRMIDKDGATVTTSLNPGDLYNSPRARKSAFYKNRMYLGDIIKNGVRYKTTIARSSYPLGIIALLNGDLTASDGSGSWVIPVTDTKYFYSDTGMNIYEVYRGNSKIATVTLSSVQQTTVTATVANTVFESGYTSFLSADEIWVSGTFTGDKQYRWVGGDSAVNRDVKQYDTFKITGGDESEITMMELIGNVLLIANRNTMMTWNDYMLENMDLGVGCVSPNGYAKLMGSLYFIHYSGVYSTTGGVPTLLSRKVDRYIKGATRGNLEKSCVGFKGLSVFFTIGDVTLYNKDGSFQKVVKDVCLEFNVGDQSWYIHTNVPALEFANFIDTKGVERLLYASSAAGASVKEFLVGSTDDGEVIFFRMDTQVMQISKSFETYAIPTELLVETERGTLLKAYIAIDEEDDFYPLEGSIRKGVSGLKITAKDPKVQKQTPVRKITVSLRDESRQTCKILQLAVIYVPTNISVPGNEEDN